MVQTSTPYSMRSTEGNRSMTGKTEVTSCEKAAFIHPTASLFGKIRLGDGISIWHNAVIRAEVNTVEIGSYTNIQDFVMIHVGFNHGVRIGPYCSITHHATIHGAVIGENCLIGINSTVMDGCNIGPNCVIGAGAVIPENTSVPINSVVVGVPARVVGQRDNFVANRLNAFAYYQNAIAYKRGNYRVWSSNAYRAAETAERRRLESLTHEVNLLNEKPIEDE